MSVVNATVPDESGNVIVLSAVGSVTTKVVSNASSVAPSKIIASPGIIALRSALSPTGPLSVPISPNAI